MIFKDISFIKPDCLWDKNFTGENNAPMFRKVFTVEDVSTSKLYFCGLGIGYCYINGKKVSDDLFTAPVSDYTKTLWYNTYDVTDLLKSGKNVIAVWCGNGWYNEEFKTPWNYDNANWRDIPKFILRLDIDGKTAVVSDNSWKCLPDTAIWFNALRSGEYFDARKYDNKWSELDFDDSSWANVVIDDKAPCGIFRECTCEPIREFESYQVKEIIKGQNGRYIFDFGQNISGYVRIKIKGEFGQMLTIRHAELVKEDNTLELNQMNKFYPESEVQTDRFICSGQEFTWSPRFVYHGFRYAEVEGLTSPDEIEIESVFVHQAVEKRTDFECSNELLNKMFKAGVYSVYSNMFYSLTDCPTREKLGWANDAQSSTEQILTNFKSENFFKKWLIDIYDAMREDGAMPGIIPTAGWGYAWGSGPVSDGILFELPYRLYLHTGDKTLLVNSIEYFDRYFAYLDSRTDEDGYVSFGLCDWASYKIDEANPKVPRQLINALLMIKFYNIALKASELSGNRQEKYEIKVNELRNKILTDYIDENGRCTVNEHTSVCMLIYFDVYDEIEPLKRQLMTLLEENEFRHDCGMVGLRCLFEALNKCGLEEYAYKVITSSGMPSFREWFEQGAVSLWEYWDWTEHRDSKNHHMYSDFMSWIVKTVLGINQITPGFGSVRVEPYFFKDMDFAKGICRTCGGDISVSWERNSENVQVEITVPEGMKALYKETTLSVGKNVFIETL